MRRYIIVIGAMLAVLLTPSASAQDSGSGLGLIREGTTTPIDSLTTLNPLFCDNDLCNRATALLFPPLFHVDPATSTFAPADTNDNALVTGWQISDDAQTYTFTLRDDLQWSDSTPVTSADAMLTLLTVTDGDADSSYYLPAFDDLIADIRAPDAQTLVVEFTTPTCRGMHLLNVPVIPAHPFDIDIPAAYNPDANFAAVRTAPVNMALPTAGKYQLAEIRPFEYVRLTSDDGQQGYEFVYLPDFGEETEAFLEGDLTFINGWTDADDSNFIAAGAQLKGGARNGVYALAFNLASPNAPRPFDTNADDGQGAHPIFSDVRVRQAVQLGVNVDELIALAWDGYGTPVSAPALADAWYATPDLTPAAYDFDRARQLLNEAGWRDTNRDGIRECRTCTTAPQGAPLQIDLLNPFNSQRSINVASLIAQQLRRIGFSVNVIGNSPADQSFDLTLDFIPLGYPLDPAGALTFLETAQDIPGSGENITSYSNPRVDDLLASAATEACTDTNARAAAYRDVQAIIADELPYVWLFSPHQLYTASNRVLNFDPYPQDPLWNIQDWIVTGVNP